MFIDPPELSSDLEWMLQSGQVGARPIIEVLIADLYIPLAALGQFILHDLDLAQQCITKTFVAVTLNQARYRAEFGARAWVFAIALRQFEQARRKQKRWYLGWGRGQPKSSGVPRPLEAAKSDPGLWQAFWRLNAQQQLLVYLQLIDGCGAAEISRITRQRENAVRSELRTAQEKFLSVITREGNRKQGIGNREQRTENGKQQALDPFDLDDPGVIEEVDHLAKAINTRWPAPVLPDTERKVLFEQIMARVQESGRYRQVSLYRRELALGGVFIALIALLGWGASRLYADKPKSAQVAVRQTVIRTVIITQLVKERHLTATPIPTVTETAAVKLQANQDFLKKSQISITLGYQDALTITIPSGGPTWFNNSGPVYLADMLFFWGWKGLKESSLLEKLQPYPDDVVVMPYELVTFVQEETPYRALMRMGGDIEMLKRVITAGFPVLIQRGRVDSWYGWSGEYELIRGFDDQAKEFVPYTFGFGDPLLPAVSYAYNNFEEQWQPFNYIYLVVYPADRGADLLKALGDQADEKANIAYAAERASTEIFSEASDLEKFYAWFNRGTSLTYLDDYGGAAKAYDEAFAILANLPIDQLPRRMLCYQTRPYWAYYYTARYADVIRLANTTLGEGPGHGLEESFYWRALAKEAMGDAKGALADLQASLKINPNFAAGLMQLQRLQGGG